jgi:FlgD Ig-like domain
MNKLYYMSITTVLLFVFLFSNLNAQIPNGNFETWNNGNPDPWVTDNISSLSIAPVTQTTDKYEGNYALKGEVLSEYNQVYPPSIYQEFAISQQYMSLTGYYKFNKVGSADVITIGAVLSDSSATGFASGDTMIANATSTYKQFTVPFRYIQNNNNPQLCYIAIALEDTSESTNDKPSAGSYFIIDDLVLTAGPTAIRNQTSSLPYKFTLNQNYPNPFNPSTEISYNIPEQDFVSLNIYDINGQLVKTLVRENQVAGAHQVVWDGTNSSERQVASGVYIYRLVSGNNNSVKKMLLLK